MKRIREEAIHCKSRRRRRDVRRRRRYEKQKPRGKYFSCYYVKMKMIMTKTVTIYLYLYELSQRTTITSFSYSLSATEKHYGFRSEDISIWHKKVKLFMFYDFRVTLYIFMAEVTSCVQMFSPCRWVFVTGRKSAREIQTRNTAR